MTDTKRVVIVGVGALGSHLVPLLRNCAKIVVAWDFDKIEAKNLMSQFHATTGLGKNKAVALQQSVNFLFKQKIGAVPHRLEEGNKDLLRNYHASRLDLVVDCVDNAATREVIQRYVRAEGVPCLHGALAENGEFGRVVWDEDFVIDSEAGLGAATCEDGQHLPFISIVSSYLASSVQTFLDTGKKVGYSISPRGSQSV